MTKRSKAARPRPERANSAPGDKLPLIEHLKELRRRLFYVAASVAVGSGIAYGFEHQILDVLLRPSHGQQFIYTSPLGGMNFLFTVCLDIGLVAATPVIIYQILAFVRPLMQNTTRKFLLLASGGAGIVALGGVLFGYFVGLPSALHFLLHQFTTVQVRPLLTIQAYMQFVALYLLGCALMFQLPLIILLINRIKPLGPSDLLKYERHLIVGAVVVAFIMNPSPNLIDQAFVVVPIILSYQIGILMLWIMQRRKQLTPVQLLLQQDAERQAERANRQLTPLAAPDLAFEEIVERQLDAADDEPDQPIVAAHSAEVIESPEPAAAAKTAQPAQAATPAPVPAPIPVPTSFPASSLLSTPEPTPRAKTIPIRLAPPRPFVRMEPIQRRTIVPLRGQLIQ